METISIQAAFPATAALKGIVDSVADLVESYDRFGTRVREGNTWTLSRDEESPDCVATITVRAGADGPVLAYEASARRGAMVDDGTFQAIHRLIAQDFVEHACVASGLARHAVRPSGATASGPSRPQPGERTL